MTVRPVVVVTGGSAGVGRATARAFASAGYDVGILARGRERLNSASREIEDAGVRCVIVPTDVADPAAVESAAAQVEASLGPIEVWVNNATTSVFSPVAQLRADEVRRVAEVAFLGSVNGILAALPRMRERDRGTIVQVGSALAYRAIPLQASYCASKFAIRGFVDSLRCELRHDGSGVHVTTVHLPALNTPQFSWVRSRMPRHPQPVPPICQPEVAARGILWAAEHPRHREYWVGGTTVATILANAAVPGMLDRYLARTNFDAQQTDQPADPDRPDNLCEPAPGNHAAHGVFDARSTRRSVQSRLSMHRRLTATGVASGAALAVVAARWRR